MINIQQYNLTFDNYLNKATRIHEIIFQYYYIARVPPIRSSILHEQLTIVRQKNNTYSVNYTLSFMPFAILLHCALNLCVGLSTLAWVTGVHTRVHICVMHRDKTMARYKRGLPLRSFHRSRPSINDLVRTSRSLYRSRKVII